MADVPPRPGDLFLHINHAVHQAAAMASAGCFHWLYVRHGGARGSGWKWHTPPSCEAFEGFQRVTFLDSRFPISPFPWYHAYRAAGGASSLTTGFILANSFRHWFPGLPLILAGFDPAHDHGSCRWHAHSWNLEDLWYRRRGFLTIPPRDP
ncbi:MAG: hypothetical protein LUG84_05190 [Akkermansiaceae bacterium]|nr:hypothetical protein [Akkermansia sp.]MCD7798789.1 hypothetical protein [Akkermansiaceae bacterium]MCD8070508.1 hypothetical protein [Akkermansiaceae bacterium]